MIQSFFDSLEDPERPFIGPNYWMLKKVGVILPKNLISKILIIIFHELVTFFVVTQFIELYMVREDLDLVITNLRVSIVSFICVTKANTFIVWQSSWKQVFDYITESDNEDKSSSDTTVKETVISYTRYCRRLIKYYWTLLVVTFLCVLAAPLTRYMSSPSFREALRNGTEPFPHIVSSWVPFDKYSFPGNWITVCLHFTCCLYGSAMMAAYDSFVIVIMVFINGKLKIIREKCKQLFGCNGLGVTEEQARITLRDLHTIHIEFIKFWKLFDSLLSPVMFLYVFMCSIMLCACVYQFTIVNSTMQKLLITQYFIYGLAPIFMFCWFGSRVLDQSHRVMMGPYESEWWLMSVKQRKNVIILTEQLKVFPVFSAGPFNYLTLSTFVAILKGAYSYYALLRN